MGLPQWIYRIWRVRYSFLQIEAIWFEIPWRASAREYHGVALEPGFGWAGFKQTFSEEFGLNSSFEMTFQCSSSWFSLFSRGSPCVACRDVKLGKLQVSPCWEEDMTMQQLCLWVENTVLLAFLEDVIILLYHCCIYWTGMYFVSVKMKACCCSYVEVPALPLLPSLASWHFPCQKWNVFLVSC